MPGDPPCWSHLFDDYEREPELEPMAKAREGRGTRGEGRGKRNARKSTTRRPGNGQAEIALDLRKFLSDNQTRIEQELFDFLRIPSVSAKSEHNGDTKRVRTQR